MLDLFFLPGGIQMNICDPQAHKLTCGFLSDLVAPGFRTNQRFNIFFLSSATFHYVCLGS